MFEGDDGRFYSSEAEWEWAYDEGCRAEMRAIMEREMADEGDHGDCGEFIGPVRPYTPTFRDDEITF